MGTKGREIVGMDVTELAELLNKALADEWLAYYQYWVGALVVKGPMRGEVNAELVQHAADELRHAGMLAPRIIQLGGTPVLSPQDWYKWTNCGYDPPEDPFVKRILRQNIAGEQCAIGVYNALAAQTRGKDEVTYNMALSILGDELEHEEDLESLLEDIELLERDVAGG